MLRARARSKTPSKCRRWGDKCGSLYRARQNAYHGHHQRRGGLTLRLCMRSRSTRWLSNTLARRRAVENAIHNSGQGGEGDDLLIPHIAMPPKLWNCIVVAMKCLRPRWNCPRRCRGTSALGLLASKLPQCPGAADCEISNASRTRARSGTAPRCRRQGDKCGFLYRGIPNAYHGRHRAACA